MKSSLNNKMLLKNNVDVVVSALQEQRAGVVHGAALLTELNGEKCEMIFVDTFSVALRPSKVLATSSSLN